MPNDPKTTQTTDPVSQPVQAAVPSADLDDKVITSSRAVLEGAQIPPSTPQPASTQIPTPSQQVPVRPAQNASQSAGKLNSMIKKVIVIGVLLVVLIGGFVFYESSVSGLSTKTLSNGGYTYTFKFYKTARKVTLSDGSSGYKSLTGVAVKGQPVLGTVPPSCSKYGGNWNQVFTVAISGQTYPVCMSSTDIYSVYFDSLDHGQLFILTYNSKLSSAEQSSVKTIFSSIKVSQ